jgi:hypothetical protein
VSIDVAATARALLEEAEQILLGGEGLRLVWPVELDAIDEHLVDSGHRLEEGRLIADDRRERGLGAPAPAGIRRCRADLRELGRQRGDPRVQHRRVAEVGEEIGERHAAQVWPIENGVLEGDSNRRPPVGARPQ